jgi:aryl-alcohol dehydrogenase-like predicted oxidoreductase
MNLSPEELKSYLDAFEKFKDVYEQYGDYSAAQLSLRFCISHPACHVVIPSGKTPDQVRENVVASDIDFISRDVFDI